MVIVQEQLMRNGLADSYHAPPYSNSQSADAFTRLGCRTYAQDKYSLPTVKEALYLRR